MASKLGCFRPVLFGCLGIVVILFIGLGIAALVAWRGVDKARVEDRDLIAAAEVTAGGEADAIGDAPTAPPGRVILDLAQGEFVVHRGTAGEGVRVKARFNQEAYELTDDLEILPDSTWVYRVRYRRTIPALQAILQSMFGGGGDSRVDVYLPPDVPIALEMHVQQGGGAADLGGMWLTEGLIDVSKGGFSLEISEPLVEPLEMLVITGSMGGLDVSGVGNASPRILDVDWRMGGANIDLGGEWLRDCDVNLAVNMGGMAVVVPRDIDLEDAVPGESQLEVRPRETSTPVLRLHKTFKRGEIDVVRR